MPEETSDASNTSQNKGGAVFVVTQLWRWPWVAGIALASIGIGANAMFSAQVTIARILIYFGIGLLAAKAIGEANSLDKRTGGIIAVLFVGAVFVLVNEFLINYVEWSKKAAQEHRPPPSFSEWLSPITTYMQSLPWSWIAAGLVVGFVVGFWLLRVLRQGGGAKGQQGRVEELEREKTAVEQRVQSLESQWKEHVFAHSWLFAKVEAQSKSISSYVEVEKVYFCSQELQTPMLKGVFGIDFRNKSLFDVSIEKTAGGHIEFNGTELEAKPRIIYDPGTVGIGGKGTITIEQRLTRPEADYITSQGANPNDFNLENLIIAVKCEHAAQDKPQHLTIPKRLFRDPQEVLNAKHESEQTSLREQLQSTTAEKEKLNEQLSQKEARIAELQDAITRYKTPQVDFTSRSVESLRAKTWQVAVDPKLNKIDLYIDVTSKIELKDFRLVIESLQVGETTYWHVPLRLEGDEEPYRQVVDIAEGEKKTFHIATFSRSTGAYTFHTTLPSLPPFTLSMPFKIVAGGTGTAPRRKEGRFTFPRLSLAGEYLEQIALLLSDEPIVHSG